MKALIIGGSHGLGFELALQLLLKKYQVFITGRKNPNHPSLNFIFFDVDYDTGKMLYGLDKIAETCLESEDIDLLVFAAGFYQEGTITNLQDQEIIEMINLGLIAPEAFLKRLLTIQKDLPEFVAITSTSQWTPRLHEPVYTSVKAGLAMFANSISLDPRVRKTLVAAPAGMKTEFWRGAPRNDETLLDPKWVAEQILTLLNEDSFKYKFAKILRDPPRIEIVEKR